MISSNQILYPDIFHGSGFRADLQCTVHKGGFESDVIFREQIPDPTALGLGTNARLQLLTEWPNTPEPVLNTNAAPTQPNALTDVTLHFGSTTIGRGKAFLAGPINSTVTGSRTPVYKSWIQSGGRGFLVESVPYTQLAPQLQQLPTPSPSSSFSSSKPFSFAQGLPVLRRTAANTNRIQLAEDDFHQQRGYVLDYTELDASETNDYDFASGTTYWITGDFIIDDTATFEGGAVLKFSEYGFVEADGDSQCAIWNNDPYHPTIFTSEDDDSVGQQTLYSNHHPVTQWNDSNYYLWLTGNSEAVNASFSYAYNAIASGGNCAVTNCQFFQCAIGLGVEGGGGFDFQNDLFSQCSNVVNNLIGDSWTLTADNTTVDQSPLFSNGGGQIFATNCIFASTSPDPDSTYAGLDNGFYSSPEFGGNPRTNGAPFQTGISGNYYLTPGISFIDAGNTTADQLGLYWFTTQTNQTIEATNVVDLGFHYPAVDTNGNPVSTLVSGTPDYLSDPTGNGLPETWETNYFGNLNQYASELDSQGSTLLYDYKHGLDPNVIFFTLSVTNFYVNHTNMPVQVVLNGGIAAYYAVLVNDINESDANWQPYTSSNLTTALGPTNGAYQVWVGLKGVATNATQTWQEITITYDTIPPTITVTNPAATVSQPMVQVQGFVSEELSSLTFDISNAVGVISNQTGYATEAYYDTNLLVFTTNSFQLYDVFVTNGLNTVTIHAADRAGNTSTSNFNVTLDYSGATNPPALNILWPRNGAQVSGTSFTLEAQVSDLTVQVAASANGQTVQGQVQRNGQVRGLTVPLAVGTNAVTVTGTDAVGNVNTMSFNVVQSSVALTVNPLASGQLNQSSVSVSGTVSDTTQIITVNGVQASFGGGSTWTAINVPVSPAGMATLTVNTYPPGSDPTTATPDGGTQAYQPQPPAIRIVSYEQTRWYSDDGDYYYDTYNWVNGAGGEEINALFHVGDAGTSVLSTNWPGTLEEPLSFAFIPQALPAVSGISYNYDPQYWTYGNYSEAHGIYDGDSEVDQFVYNPKLVLDNGGEGAPGTTQSWLVYFAIDDYTGSPVLPEDFTVGGQALADTGAVNDNGDHWGVAPVNFPAGAAAPLSLTPKSPAVSSVPLSIGFNNDGSGQDYEFNVKASNVTILANGIDLSTNTPQFCVGQLITFAPKLGAIPGVQSESYQWTFNGNFFNAATNAVPGVPFPICSGIFYVDTNKLTNVMVTNWWISGSSPLPGSNYTATLSIGLTFSNRLSITDSVTGSFNMFRPNAKISPITSSVAGFTNSITGREKFGFGIVGAANGITFFWTNDPIPSQFMGHGFHWLQVQLQTTEYCVDTNNITYTRIESTNFPILDQDPWPTNAFLAGNPVDSPASILPTNGFVKYYRYDEYQMLLLFAPPTPCITVPLRTVTWYWSGTVTNSGIGNNWGLESDPNNHSQNPSDTDATNYILWVNDPGTNYYWNPPNPNLP